ncbi:MAG: Rrf2 family transcriptional regulator [Deltaproteobacteria bacterium]|nr:Rrf2 family transcriptional regulator [Deltaproteobacteria bacterium]
MISKTGLHAIRALVELAALPEGSYAGASNIAKQIGAPQNYLGKLLQVLSRAGVVVSQKGVGGGFRLAKKAEATSLYEVIDPIDPIEHVVRWKGCFLGGPKCSPKRSCKAHKSWTVAREAYLKFLKETSIADLSAGS